MTSATTLTAPPVVVMDCGDMTGARLERRVRALVSTVPAHVRLVATTKNSAQLSRSTAQRVEIVVTSDRGAELVGRAVELAASVIALPVTAKIAPGWYEEASARLTADDERIGVLPLGRGHVFAIPAGVRTLEAPHLTWDALPGVELRGEGPHQLVTLGAVLIVKDEEAVLGACLAALAPVVDEVVVYDTGSTDGTVQLARNLGARVVEGHWDDDFGAARNRALEHASCDWVLSVDADEVLQADRDTIVAWLSAADGDAALVRVVSTSWRGASEGDELRAVRLFRRVGAAWTGALHEQVVAAPSAPPRRSCSSMPPLHLLHSGYSTGHDRAEEKADRNLRISQRSLALADRDDPRWSELAVDHARSLGLAGRLEESLALLQEVDVEALTAGNCIQAARVAVPLLLERGRCTEADTWTEHARSAGESPGRVVLWSTASAAIQGRLVWAAREIVRLLEEGAAAGGRDLWGRAFDMDLAIVALAELELAAGHSQSSAGRMVELMLKAPQTVPLALLFRSVLATGTPLTRLAARAPRAFVDRSLREAPVAAPDLALAWFNALADAAPEQPGPVVAGCVLAARTGVEVALEWSVRARELGLADLCPLRTIGQNLDLHPRARVLALALLDQGLADRSLQGVLHALLPGTGEEDRQAVLTELRVYVPTAASLSQSAA